jgi:uncharacterized protein (TIGR02996 family)
VTDGYALLRAIEANADEDTPRLVYADWLEEHATSDADRGRAEFIRLQCAVAREPPGKRRTALAVREHQLLDWHHKEWERAYPPSLPTGSYTRGFMFMRFTAADFAKYGEQLAALTVLSDVWLTDAAGAMARLAACPALGCVRSLHLAEVQNRQLVTLLGSPHLRNVSVLDLGGNAIKSAGCAALAATAALPGLRVLALGSHPIKDRGLDALVGAPWFANLVGLYVPDCGLSGAAVARLAQRPTARRLRALNVNHCTDPETAARAVLDSPHLSKLQRLWCWCLGDHLSEPVIAALHTRFGANLNLGSYRIEWTGGEP